MAVGPYDHVCDLATGEVAVEGVDLNFLRLPTLEIFHCFTHGREFDVAEMSFGRYNSLFSQDAPIIEIPVFPSRLFRLASIFVPAGGRVTRPEDLARKRVAVPEWSQTATIYVRGWLQHQIEFDLRGIRWYTAGNHGANPHGEQVALKLPKGIEIMHVGDRSIGDLLAEGGVDAVFAAGAPHQFLAGDRRIVRLFPDFRAAEEAYHRATGIFPIMRVICLRRGPLTSDAT
jgi:4,5-dihydroxyphthalate decarboxylase